MTRFALAAASLLVLSACGSGDSAADAGAAADAEGEQQTDSSTLQTLNEEGGDVTISAVGGETAEFPEGFTSYPGGTTVISTTVDSEEGSGIRIMMTTSDSADEVIAFYRRQAENAGFEITTEVNFGGQQEFVGTAADGTRSTVQAVGGEGNTTINLFITKGL
jgi:hypothetical protein